jgi:hypothetical protein
MKAQERIGRLSSLKNTMAGIHWKMSIKLIPLESIPKTWRGCGAGCCRLGFHANKILHGPASQRMDPPVWPMLVTGILPCSIHRRQGSIQLIASEDAGWYPQEIKGETPSFGTDIHMSAKCIVWLGGDPQSKYYLTLSPPHKGFLRAAFWTGRLTQNAWNLKENLMASQEALGQRNLIHLA